MSTSCNDIILANEKEFEFLVATVGRKKQSQGGPTDGRCTKGCDS